MTTHTSNGAVTPDVDAIVLGAGFSGVYLLKRLRDLGFTARAFEAGSDVGGTWFWNRYPGARCDSDSSVYCFSERFDADLANSWRWSERYPAQKELHTYISTAVDSTGLRDSITFDTRVESVVFDEATNLWTVTTDSGETATARYFLPAVGALTKPSIPDFAGLGDFAGEIHHTARMPEEVSLAGRRVAVIGSGATAVQIVPIAARQAEHVYQLQRTASHCLPGRNHELDDDDYAELDAHRSDIWSKARANPGGFPYADAAGMASEMDPAAQREVMERAWQLGGLVLAFASFGDLLVDPASNKVVLDFIGEKIRSIVKDPEVARKLTPTTPFVTKRPPIEHGYYEAFNRPNVSLLDIAENPVERFTESGIVLTDGTEIEVDLVLMATGFDAFTGALSEIDIRGVGGATLADHFAERYDNFLGLSLVGFPNMFMQYCGPLGPAILTNALTLIEEQGEWIVTALDWLRSEGVVRSEVSLAAQEEFTQLHEETAAATLIPSTNSWWTGTNIDGKKRGLVSFCGGFPVYSELLVKAASDYRDYELVRS